MPSPALHASLVPTLVALASLAAVGCSKPTPSAYMESHRATLKPRVESFRKVGTAAGSADPAPEAIQKGTASSPVVLCPLDGRPGEDCNTLVLYTQTLTAPEAWRQLSNRADVGRVRFHHASDLVDIAQMLDGGRVFSEKEDTRKASSKPVYLESSYELDTDQLIRATKRLEHIAYVLAVRPRSRPTRGGPARLDADVYLYELATTRPISALRVNQTCGDTDYVYFNGGGYAGSTDCLDGLVKNDLRSGVARMVDGARVED